MKLGLHGIRTLLATLGNPHRNFPSIHVAGTNGKGSTSSMLAAVFTAAGYRTGLYTSPHLVSFTERIRIDGKPIPRKDVARLTNLIKRQVKRQKATYFEAVTAIAFKYFSDSKVDIAIVETGLGGRLDATNVLRPLVSIITNVSLEHTAILGNTLESIAYEKAGIIKRAIPCVTGIVESKPLAVVRRRARAMEAPLINARTVDIRVIKSTLDGFVVNAKGRLASYHRLRVSLAGNYQIRNLRAVLCALEVICLGGGYSIELRHIREGLGNVESLSGLRGRLNVLHRRPLIIGDVAHNPDSTRRLVQALEELKIRNVFLVFGVVQDKDYSRMVRFLKPVTQSAILTKARTERSRATADLSAEFARQRIHVSDVTRSVARALDRAIGMRKQGLPILIAGSHYVLGEAFTYLRSRKFT